MSPKLCASTCFPLCLCGQELMAGRTLKENGSRWLSLCTPAVALGLCWIFFSPCHNCSVYKYIPKNKSRVIHFFQDAVLLVLVAE